MDFTRRLHSPGFAGLRTTARRTAGHAIFPFSLFYQWQISHQWALGSNQIGRDTGDYAYAIVMRICQCLCSQLHGRSG